MCEDAVDHDIIGGPGIVVEIDESHFCTVKQGQGRNRRKPQNWIFAGMERESKKFFAVSLGLEGRRDMATLEPLIINHIRPGSIIMSDSWRAYRDIDRLVDPEGRSMNYEHHTVNHRVGFTDPNNPWIHTQTIERRWGDVKGVVKRRGVSKKVEQHLYRYRFIKKYPINTLHHLMVEAGKCFPFSRFVNTP